MRPMHRSELVPSKIDPDQLINLVTDPVTGELVNPLTGEVIDDHPIAYGYEYRYHKDDYREYVSRAHYHKVNVVATHDSSLYTVIDAHRAKNRALARKLQVWQRRCRVDRKDRALVTVLQYINNICKIMGLPEHVLTTAATIARKLREVEPLRSDRVLYIASACVLTAAKMSNIPITYRDIMNALDIDVDNVKEFQRNLWRELKKIRLDLGIAPSIVSPEEFVKKLVTKLELSTDVEKLSIAILRKMKEKGLAEGRDPLILAGSAVYVSSILLDEKRTQKQVAQAMNTNEAGLRWRYKDIVERLNIEVYL